MKVTTGPKNRIKDTVCDSRFHPDGEIFAIGTLTSRVELYRSGTKVKDISNHHNESSIRKIRFDSSGNLLTAARIVRIYDLESQKTSKLKLKKVSGSKDKIYSLATFGSNMVSAGTDSGGFHVWDTRKGREPVFATHDNEGYISDITGSIRKHLYLTSGYGYITGYDMRKLKWLDKEPAYFDTGFHCVQMSQDKKLIVGTESGALYVFKRNDFQTIDTKMALANDSGNRGEKGINALETLPDSQTFMAACTDGKLRSFNYVGNQYETLGVHHIDKEEVESIHLNPKLDNQLLCSGPSFVQVIEYENEVDNEESDDGDSDSDSDSDADVKLKLPITNGHATNTKAAQREEKKIRTENSEDYLNLF